MPRPLSKELKDAIETVASTTGMLEYDCWYCHEPFASTPDLVDEEKPECGLCEMELRAERRDAYGLERTED